MNHFQQQATANITTVRPGSYNVLETPPITVQSSISPMSTSSPPSSQPLQAFGQSMTAQSPTPSSPPPKAAHSNTFVHKLYNMVLDSQYQHLIAWSYTGSSFIVCNIMEFSRDVLPKHFKHNNFSSFVRQLNMYGFHKVNKSPRGHRTLAENQIWEFSHPKFLRNRSDLLDDIKRKAMESTDNVRRENGDLQAHITMMQVAQSDMMQQINHLFESINEVIKDLAETKRKQAMQQQVMQNIAQYISQQAGGHVLTEFGLGSLENKQDRPPSIFITSPDPVSPAPMQNMFAVSRGPLSVQTQNLHYSSGPELTLHASNRSPLPTLSPFGSHLSSNSSARSLVSDDESHSLYSPHSPHSPHTPNIQSSTHSAHGQLSDAYDPPTPQPSSNGNQTNASFTFVNQLDPLSHR